MASHDWLLIIDFAARSTVIYDSTMAFSLFHVRHLQHQLFRGTDKLLLPFRIFLSICHATPVAKQF